MEEISRTQKESHKKSLKVKDYFEVHSGKLQFIVNSVLVAITVFAMFLTWYFSSQNLKLSTAQFNLAMNQFNHQRKQDSLNKINDSVKDRILNVRLKNDSIKQEKKDKIEYEKDQNQRKLNIRQLQINGQQLSAIKSQASTAKNQLDAQIEQFKEQSYERKPYFMIDNVTIDSSVKYKPKISFTFTNRGIRPAHVDSTILAFYNIVLGCHSITPNTANLDASPQQNSLFTSQINIFDDCLISTNTIFYLIIYYRDFATDQPKEQAIFFQYKFSKDHQFLYSRLSSNAIGLEFKNYLTKHKVAIYD
jgi:hypothetical protein